MKEYCIFAQVVQRQWPWNSLMNRYLSDDFISPSQARRLKNHSKHFFHILPVSRDISPALILMLMSINLLIWRQLRLMPFVRMRACAFHWARRWFALLSVRVIKPQHGVEHLIDFFNLFCVENGSNGIHSDISKAHMWAVNTHTHTNQLLSDHSGGCHTVKPLAALELMDCSNLRQRQENLLKMCESVEKPDSFTTSHHLKEPISSLWPMQCFILQTAKHAHVHYNFFLQAFYGVCLALFLVEFEAVRGSHQGTNYSFKDCLVSSIFYGRCGMEGLSHTKAPLSVSQTIQSEAALLSINSATFHETGNNDNNNKATVVLKSKVRDLTDTCYCILLTVWSL